MAVTALDRFSHPAPRPPVAAAVRMGEAVRMGDPAAFVAGVAALVGGPVRLYDAEGRELARRDPWPPAGADDGRDGRGRRLVLHHGGAVLGTVELGPSAAPDGTAEDLVTALGTALLRLEVLGGEVRELEHRVRLLTWAGGGTGLSAGADGPDPAQPCRPVVVNAPTPLGRRAADRLLTHLRQRCADEPLLASIGVVAAEGELSGLYADEPAAPPRAHAQAWARALAGAPVARLAVSVGRRATAGAALRDSHGAARAVARLQRSGSPHVVLPAVAVAEELGPVADVLHGVANGEVAPFVQRVLGDLLTDARFGGRLVETLHAYLVTGGSPREAGRLLHLHTSSVKYRIRVLRELVGARLDDPVQRLDLALAVRLVVAARAIVDGAGADQT